ncbi:MAG: lamin tail domain-containing protein [Nanoarchaeota archaeon]|nr:lamin tail domain-containing protein [Nanoarchaeota archaeon]
MFAYGEDTTHPALTDVIVEEYNKRHPEKIITPEQKELLIKGSMLEDTPPRWVNHLYDPILKIGWNGEKLGKVPADVVRAFIAWGIDPKTGWFSAIDWVDNRSAQARYERYGGDRTWTRALEYYANNDKDEAYLTLGHTLHLIEDMGVPDHTRNDPHPHSTEKLTGDTGSPYENYAKKWTRKNIRDGIGTLDGLSSVSKGTIRDYLESMALYSNKYFFSKDSINDPAYEFPKIVKEEKGFGYGVDENRQYFRLSSVDEYFDDQSRQIKKYALDSTEKYNLLYDAYFSRLSRQIVAHGVGALELFEREARDYIPQHITRIDAGKTPFGGLWSPGVEVAKLANSMGSFFGNIGSAFGKAAGFFKDTFFSGETEEVSLTQNDDDGGGRISKGDTTSYDDEDAETFCSFATSKKPLRNSLLLSEIAWMGSTRSAQEEWMEVRNPTGRSLDVSGFQIVDLKEDIRVRLPAGSRIGVNGLLLLERSESAVPGVQADVLYAGSLSNSGEGVRLYDPKCNLLDEVLTGSPWPAGDNATKQTMERSGNLLWHTSEKPGGTPRAVNSTPVIVKEEEDPSIRRLADSGDMQDEDAKSLEELKLSLATSSLETGNSSSKSLTSKSAPPALSFQKCSYDTSASPKGGGARINEVAWMGSTRDANDEWFEVFNGSGSSVDVSGWQILDKGEQIHITLPAGTSFPSDGHLLFERTDDNSVPGVSADAIYTGGLSNSDEGLRLFDSRCQLVDEALANPLWSAGSNSSKGTMERKDDGSWQTSGVQNGTPRAKNTFIAPSGGGSPSPPSSPSSLSSASSSESEAATSSPAVLNHLVISEFQAGSGADAKYEFVELWNPTDVSVDLTGWDLKKKTSGGNLQNLAMNIASTTRVIAAKGFFLIASREYNGSAAPDARYTQTSNTLAGSNNSIVLMNAADETVDEIFYESLAADASYERKAFSGGVCISSLGGGGEYAGHGCDASGDITDFELRVTPRPQNTLNMPEPRAAPAGPVGVGGAPLALYSSSSLLISLAWDRVADYAGGTSTVLYEARNLSSSSALLYSGTSTSYSYAVSEVGTSTLFSVRAYDREGLGSVTSTLLVEAPSFFTSLSFYADPRSGGNRYLLDAYYDAYPFVPDVYGRGAGFSAIVFYLNSEPDASNTFLTNAAPGWEPINKSSILRLAYDRCAGAVSAPGASLLLPHTAGACGTGGGLMNSVLVWGALEDKHFLMKTASTTSQISLSSNDYVTAAFYSFYQSGGGQQTLGIAAIDRTKHYFSSSPPSQAAPTVPSSPSANLNEARGTVLFSFASSTDLDTLDNFIAHEVAYTTSSDLSSGAWTLIGYGLQTNLNLNFGETYLIGVRAKDDFGNLSSSTRIEYTVPIPAPPLTVSNIRWGHINSTSTREVIFQFDDYAALLPISRTLVAFYLNAVVPDKTGGPSAFNEILNDGFSRLFVQYAGCAGNSTTDRVIFRASSTTQCSGGYGNSYLPSGAGFPPSGEAKFTLTGGPYAANDYITVLFLKIVSPENLLQIGRYAVPVYFTE